MLEAGHQLARSGRDVVAGFVETHGRPETEAQIGDLEVIPRLPVAYRGMTLEEMNTGAVLERQPDIVLVDELAHTNAAGSEREKRYQDVQLLLEAGIDVLTTMNIQHLESVNQLVESVTGVTVRETVPDTMMRDAEIELIDLPPNRLRDRLREGKVYPPERALRALDNYFQETNLTALRELALRWTAEGVETTLERYLWDEPGARPVLEVVVAALDDRPEAETVIRHAWRIANGLKADLVAVTVVPQPLERLPGPQRDILDRHLELAADLAARSEVVVSNRIGDALAEFARRNHATDLVLGRPEPSRIRALLGRSLIDFLLEQLPDVDIHVVSRSSR
jgi:two-component system sensor histidine kinase KdpD